MEQIKYFVEKATGQLLDEFQMNAQLRTKYRGMDWREVYESVKCVEVVDGENIVEECDETVR